MNDRYLSTDHPGSISVVTAATGAVVSQQAYDPWGRVRSGGISQTSLDYTSQRKDGAGLLHYYSLVWIRRTARVVDYRNASSVAEAPATALI